MRPTIRLVLITALRDRLFLSLYGLLAAALGLSSFLASGAIVEAAEMSLVYMAGAARAILALGIIVFVAFHVERMFDTREIEAILARSISRPSFVFAYWIGLALMALGLVLPIVIVVGLAHISGVGAAFWSISVFLEMLIVLAFALFAGLTFERAVPTVLTTVGFYAMARSVGFFLGIVAGGQQSGVNVVLNPYIDAISMALPRLDLFAQSRWLVYGPEDQTVLAVMLTQTLIYVLLLLLAASHDLVRKHF